MSEVLVLVDHLDGRADVVLVPTDYVGTGNRPVNVTSVAGWTTGELGSWWPAMTRGVSRVSVA